MNPEMGMPEIVKEYEVNHYENPEALELDILENFLKEGDVKNTRPIEDFAQKVSSHADRVLIGDITPHADQLFEAEIHIPGEDRPILGVYKPETGINHGTDTGRAIDIPKDSSSYMNKEVAAWIVLKNLDLAHLGMPVVQRTLNEGKGSFRPYIWGETLDSLSEENIDKALSDRSTLEEIALYDYLLQTIDRRFSNLILEDNNGKKMLKVIDHSLTFFDENFTKKFHIKGPRLMIAHDNSTDPPKLKKAPLPDVLIDKLNGFIENKDAQNDLSKFLTESEIKGVYFRANKLIEAKIFL